jgi:CRISPR-associated protein Cas2
MKAEEARFVWLMVFFDLPVGTKPERRDANRFRNFLKDDGFLMLQYSVYARICRAEEASEKHIKRIVSNLPSSGSVRALQVTDRQFARMRLLLGEAPKSERVAAGQMVLL